jgi:hypothetical protein
LDGSILKDYQDSNHLKHIYTLSILSVDRFRTSFEPLATNNDMLIDGLREVFNILEEQLNKDQKKY